MQGAEEGMCLQGWTRELEALALLLQRRLCAESYREALEKTGLFHVGPFYTKPLLEILGIREAEKPLKSCEKP